MMMRKLLIGMMMMMGLLSWGGCANKADQIRDGMTETEVVRIMGSRGKVYARPPSSGFYRVYGSSRIEFGGDNKVEGVSQGGRPSVANRRFKQPGKEERSVQRREIGELKDWLK